VAIFKKWCETKRSEPVKLKRLWLFTEKQLGRSQIQAALIKTVRDHYDSAEQIANDIEELGYAGAASILGERLPRTKKARSGELGEILATELVEEELGFNVPVRRLRYKDGREMALRGDDFIGVGFDSKDALWLLKGEAKSRATLGKTTITQARASLDRDSGRCTPSSLLFVADRLLERTGDAAELGRAIRKEVGLTALRKARIDHVLFTLSGNSPPTALEEGLIAADTGRRHTVINLRIEDHQDFIASIYKGAINLGDI
jgi:hypothetical protein